MIDIKEFAEDWVKEKYPNDYLTIVCDNVLEFAQDWTNHKMDLILEEFRDLNGETNWWYIDRLEEIIEDSKPETLPPE